MRAPARRRRRGRPARAGPEAANNRHQQDHDEKSGAYSASTYPSATTAEEGTRSVQSTLTRRIGAHEAVSLQKLHVVE